GGSGNRGGGDVIDIGAGLGGAISNRGALGPAVLTANNLTLTNNRALGGTGNTGGPFAGAGVGGAFLNDVGAIAVVNHSRVAANWATAARGGAGGDGSDGLGGGLANAFGSTLTVSDSTITANQTLGGEGGADGNGGNGLGGGLFNDGPSI